MSAEPGKLFFDHFGIPFGMTPEGKFKLYFDNRHLLTFGPTRSGKGASVIVPALLTANHSVLCIDPKGQNAAITARQRRALGQNVYLINPFNELGLGTHCINPLARLRIDQPNVVADVRSLADALIIGSAKDPHWTDSALDLITALLLYLIATKGGAATLPQMRALLTLPQADFLDVIRIMTGMVEYPFICQPAARFGNATKEIGSILSTAITQTFFLDDPNIAHVLGKADFSLGVFKLLPTTAYVILPGRYIDAYARFFRLVVTTALDQLTERPGGIQTLLICDEAATLQNLSAVSRAFGFAAGYNVQLWPFFQDLPQLKTIYGDRWESFAANAGLIQFFTPADMTTAEYMQRRGGVQFVEEESLSKSEISAEQRTLGYSGIGRQYRKEQRPNLPPEITMSLEKWQQYVFISGTHAYTQINRINYWDNPRLDGLHDADPFHK